MGNELTKQNKVQEQVQVQTQEQVQASTEQKLRIMNDQYMIRKMDETQYNIQAGKISADSNQNIVRKNVRDAIINNLGRDRYDAFDGLKIKRAGDAENENIVLHHAMGSKLNMEGEDVIEFNMAGSGYRNFTLMHKGVKGTRSKDDYNDEKKAEWYNKNKFLTWTKICKTESQIEEDNVKRSETNKKIEEIYGQKVDQKVKGKTLNHLRKTESVNSKQATKTRFYMRGPNAANIGKYSEDNLEEYIFELGTKALKNKLDSWEWLEDEELKEVKPVNLIIQGHSRGAIASGLGAMRIKRWISDKYPRLLNKVKFQLIQYDPVAGGIENFGFNAKIDHAPGREKDAKKDSRYMSLGEEADTTVVYSMHQQHEQFFTPQYVKNAKRLILTVTSHAVNLDKVDQTQDKPTRVTYLAEKGGKVEAFRSTGLAELDGGVYIADDQNNLIKINSLEEYDALAKTLLKDTKTQAARHEVVRKAVASCLAGNEVRSLKEKKAREAVNKPVKTKEEQERENFRKEINSLLTPEKMKNAEKLKANLDQMPRSTTKQYNAYMKQKEKYLAAKKSGMINYVNHLCKQKGSYLNDDRKKYLNYLINLSYQLEKDNEGFHNDARDKKIRDAAKQLRACVGTENLDVFLPAYLRKELFLGSEEKVKAYFGITDKKKGLFESFTDIEELNAPQEPVVKEEKAVEKEPVVKEEKAVEKEPVVEEKAEKVEEKAVEKEPAVEEKAEKVEEKAVEKEPVVEEKAEKVEEKKAVEKEPVVEEKAEKVEEKKAVEKEPAVEEKAEKVEEKKASEKEQDVKEEKAEEKAKINENDEELDDLDDFEVQPVEKEKKAGEVEVKAEKKAEKAVEKKALMNADNYYEIPFTKYDVKTDITGMDAVYESQGANNCYAVTGTALLNHFISRKKGEKQVVKRYDQWNMRSFKPQVRKYDPNNKAGLDIVAYNSSVKYLASYAGEGKEEFGSLFDMGDFLMEKLAENEIENVMLNRYNITVPEVDAKEAKEKEETKLRNYRALFTDKISRIITEGGVAGVLITERGYSHYVTITGIKDDELTVYDSSGYKGKAKTVKLDSLIKRGRGLEINWLSDIKEPQEMEKEYPNLKHDADKGYQVKAETFEDFYPSIGLTGGVVVSKDADGNAEGIEDVTQMAYIPVKNMQVEKKQLGDAAQEVSEWEQAQKEAERREAERKAAEQFDTSVNTLFGEIFKGRNKLPEILNDINYSFKREKDEKPYYNRMRSALLRIQKLAEKVGDVKKAPLTQELMDAVTVLSESANAYFDEHRGTQISTRGSRRKIGCESLRDLVKEFYDRLDRKTGGKGLGNVTESNMPYGVSKKEADDAPNKLAELVKNYDKWKKHFADREGLDRVTVRDKAHLFAVYERDIAIYKALVPIKKRPEAIDEIIRTADLYKLQNATITKFEEMHSGFSDPISKLARAHADAMDERPEPEKELKKKEIDKGLTNEQLKAVDDIDQWFIRNYSNAGWVGWAVGARNHHGEAVSNLLSKTKRERLFIYYLIETKKRKAPELYDVFVSQTDYIPDLAKFKKRMVSHWLKVISHLSGEYVAMHKLSEASQINREYQQIVKSCSDPVTADKYVDLTKLKEDKVAYRAYMLEQVFKSTKACKDKSEELLKKQKNKKEVKPDAELIELRKKAAADLKELIAADVAVGEAEKYGELTEEGKIKSNNIYNPANSNVGDLSTNTKYYAKYGAKAAENTGTVVKGAVEGVNLVQQGVEKIIPSASGMGEWKLKDSFMANTDFFAGNVTAGGISAVGGLLAAAYGIYSLTRGTSNMHAGDIGANVVKILNSGASAVTTVIKGVEATEQYISAADKVLQGTLTVSPALKIAGTVTAGVSTGLETYNTVSGLLDRRNAAKASSYLKKKNAGEETKDTKQAKFEKNMLKVSKDISAKKTRSGGLGTLGSGLSVAGLFVPVAGTALTFVGLGITVISGAVNIFGYDIKRIRKTMFDSYFGFDAFLKEAELLVQAQGQEIYDKKEFRKRMRRTLAASAGFSDVGSACDHVAKKYSDYICAKLFGGEGERSTDENERNAFIQLIKSFGLPYNEEKQIPSADALARKMNGR